MPPKEQSCKQRPPSATESASSARRMGTRSKDKGVEPTTVKAMTQKRKAKDLPPVDQPTKRSNRRGLNVTQTDPPEKTNKSKASIRRTPARPAASSDSEDEEDDTANRTTDGDATSPLPSGDEADELLNAIQLANELPATTIVPAARVTEQWGKNDIGNDCDNSESPVVRPTVPALGPSFQQPEDSPANMPNFSMKASAHPQAHLFLNHGSMGFVPPVLAWPGFTDLVQEDNRSYKQTSQTTKFNNCLSAVVKRANSNLLLINSCQMSTNKNDG
ncbi:hypothetical protein BJ322DRAFT_1017247 [Thelephora terrestris]|uniref:Uncharacterized protein n=1 Tax=Thelephora terrestris TaxID=56493 RepID=A0A9P6LA80_9AGAM|nr:hypothetical protein BJ322DRAFT_1017247 [Thelephora terrestris]